MVLVAVVSLVAMIGTLPTSAQEEAEDPGLASDREALIALYEATGGDDWNNSDGWLGSGSLSYWYGVSTDRDGRVTGLDLASNGLVGELPPELGDLELLEHLDLGNNDLVGELPAELGSLSNLVEMDLQNNRLERSIPPEFAELSKLTLLDLKYNSLWGAIPAELGELAELRILDLRGNSMSRPIPPELGGLVRADSPDVEVQPFLRGDAR